MIRTFISAAVFVFWVETNYDDVASKMLSYVIWIAVVWGSRYFMKN